MSLQQPMAEGVGWGGVMVVLVVRIKWCKHISQMMDRNFKYIGSF